MDSKHKFFREEALRQHLQPERDGSLVELSPVWTRAASWVLASMVVICAVALAFVSINDYATGPALIDVPTSDVLATATGRVSRIAVKPGAAVEAGDVLVDLRSESERARHAEIEAEFRRQLASALLNPTDPQIQELVSGARTQLELSRIAVEERSVRSPEKGIVTDVHVQTGDHLETGMNVATIRAAVQEARVVALLPGRYRPMLSVGQPLRLELDGFPYEYLDVAVTSVSNTLLGPSEIRRLLGPGLGDAIAVNGPTVIATAILDDEAFRSHQKTYSFYTGMPGRARVRIRARNGWLTLFPVLEHLRNNNGR